MDRQDDKTTEPPKPEVKRELPVEHGGRKGLDPTRYGDWEKKGLAIDF